MHTVFLVEGPVGAGKSTFVDGLIARARGEDLRVAVVAVDPSQPSADYEFVEGAFAAGRGKIGFIDSVSQPFCGGCDRLRLTAEGKVRNCLFGREEWDVAELLQALQTDPEKLRAVLRESVLAKHPSHGIADPDFQPPQRAMYQIGG